MKLKLVFGALMLCMGLVGRSYGFEFLDRMLGLDNSGSDCNCCEPKCCEKTCCAAEASCGCEKSCGCQQACGCEKSCGCASCGCEKSCGCSSCGCASCGCEKSCCCRSGLRKELWLRSFLRLRKELRLQ